MTTRTLASAGLVCRSSALGTAPGGDSGSLDIGPEYGAPGPDGTWWFLDAAKARIAHYDSAGRYLDQVRIEVAVRTKVLPIRTSSRDPGQSRWQGRRGRGAGQPLLRLRPGQPAQLVMAPGSSIPMLVYVLTDGVHVFERTG